MGDVVRAKFGRKRAVLTGFLPDELGAESLERAKAAKRRLLAFARSGGPTLDHDNPKPEDWWKGDGGDCA